MRTCPWRGREKCFRRISYVLGTPFSGSVFAGFRYMSEAQLQNSGQFHGVLLSVSTSTSVFALILRSMT